MTRRAIGVRALLSEHAPSPDEPYWRPAVRGDCAHFDRPCPFMGCRYHLAVSEKASGALWFEHGPDVDLASMPATCALDVADEGPHDLDEVSAFLGVTRERVRQIEVAALVKLRAFGFGAAGLPEPGPPTDDDAEK